MKTSYDNKEDLVIKKRLEDIKSGMITGKTEKELDDYLRSRDVDVD